MQPGLVCVHFRLVRLQLSVLSYIILYCILLLKSQGGALVLYSSHV